MGFRARNVILGCPKTGTAGKAVALCKDAFFTGEPSNDETTRIQENQKGTVPWGDHLQRDIACASDLPGRLRHRTRGNEEARKDQSGEGQLRRDEEGATSSSEEGATASAEETGDRKSVV